MGLIHVLPPNVAASIAAGEVVERPASVVKELIENALDAGAGAIQVEISGGGLDLVRVSDNGRGMDRADAPLALERFSTSKIRQAGDLAAIRTLGFRGEALAAIAAVAGLSILTRTAGELEGTRAIARDGQVIVEPAASPPGCSVAVTGLFRVVPARRKFLKSPLHESELCRETVLRYALAFPSVAFRLSIDGRERLAAPPAGPLERAGLVLGRETAAEMLPVSWQAGELRVEGLISSPAIGHSRRDGQHFILNGRPIRSGLMAVMLERPYAGRLPPGRSPLAVLHITLDPALVDVNVHPRKAEVRLAQERAVYQAVTQAVSAALTPFPVQEMLGVPGWPFPETPFAPAAGAVAEGGAVYEVARRAEALGQLQNTYVIARAFDELIVLDQHAAHEAALTERLRAGAGAVALSPPARLAVTAQEADLLAGHLDVLADLGLEIEPFGAGAFLLRTLPAPLAGQDGAALVTDLLPELAAGRDLAPDLLRDRLAAKAACRAAVKAGDLMALDQQQALLDELLAAWSPSTCPHGRPALFRLTVDEIERRFLRR